MINKNSKNLIFVILFISSISVASFNDNFETGLSNWEVTTHTGASFTEYSGYPGISGRYQIGQSNGWIQVTPQAWNDSQLPDGDYHFSADFKFLSNDMECILAIRANDLWVLDYYGISFSRALESGWQITIYGPYENPGPIYTSESVPDGFIFYTDSESWNHVDLVVQGTRLEVRINGVLLYKGKGHSSRSLTGRFAVRTGWFGDFAIDNVAIDAVQPPATCEDLLLAGYGLVADINYDCYINLEDFAYLASRWLTCNDPLLSDCDQVWD